MVAARTKEGRCILLMSIIESFLVAKVSIGDTVGVAGKSIG